jgi:hypothetical protein
MKPVEIVLRKRGGRIRESDGEQESLLRYTVSTCVNVTMNPLHY